MSRRRVVAKRETLPDPKFGSDVLAKFINHLMVDGKKSVAERIVYGALERAFEKAGKKVQAEGSDDDSGESGNGSPIIRLFTKALDNIRPTLEVKSRRVGGSTYQVPVEVRPARSMALAMRWLVECAKKRSEKTMILRLAGEILDALEGRGAAIKKREDVHKMAKANQAFAHFRW